MHAEMNVLRFAKPGDVVEVMRFSKCSHQLTMAKPCPICMMHMKEAGISEVRYTNWEGKWETIKLQSFNVALGQLSFGQNYLQVSSRRTPRKKHGKENVCFRHQCMSN